MVIIPKRFRLRPKALSSGTSWPGSLRLLFCKWSTVITSNAPSANRYFNATIFKCYYIDRKTINSVKYESNEVLNLWISAKSIYIVILKKNIE